MIANDGKVNLRGNAGLRLMVLFGAFSVCFLVLGGILLGLSAACGGDQNHTYMMLTSALQCLIVFCLPAWLCARYSSDSPGGWLGLNTSPSLKGIIGVILLFVLALPALNQVIYWNENIHFPEWASGIEKSFRDMEDQAATMTKVALDYQGIWGMLATVGVVGVLTGFSEEMFFRGALQGIMSRSRIGNTASIWIGAVVFTTMHFQFFGFVPRLLMGAMFGYLFNWSRTLWLPIFAHALNNSVVVVSNHFIGGADSDGVNGLGIVENGEIPWAALASLMATAIFLYRFRKYFFIKTKSAIDS